MKDRDSRILPRRTFLISSLLIGGGMLDFPSVQESPVLTAQKAKEELSAEEKKWVEDSILAEDLKNYFGRGYSCAESLLMVSLRFLKKPEDLVWAAAGFGGGMYRKDLCGFLTGGFMALGFACGMLDKPRKEAKEYCGGLVEEYWQWWGQQAPTHCSQIRTGESTSQVCMNQGLLSAAKIEELLGSLEIV